jgi:predicted SAM-dependent methyltransferase
MTDDATATAPATEIPAAVPETVLPPPPYRLHVGSGKARLEGWVNLDVQALPGVDVVCDVTKGLGFADVEAVFAEHFLEHLALADAVGFLLECHQVLNPGGWVRLSTPNLEWVWATHYRLDLDDETKRLAALQLNRAFHGWRHQFLWNRQILREALEACGFDGVRWCRYGESELALFQGIERHEIYADAPDLPHVLIVEARKGEPRPERLQSFRDLIERELLIHLAD